MKHLIPITAIAAAASLSGCVPPPAPPPPPVVAVAPPPVAMAVAPAPVVLVPTPPPPPIWHRRTVAVVHHAPVRHPAHRYVIVRTGYQWAGCGSVVRPCNIEHVTVPIQ